MPKHWFLPQFAKALGFQIQERRRKRGWTQEKLALLCNLHRSHMGQIERGETNLTLSTIVTIREEAWHHSRRINGGCTRIAFKPVILRYPIFGYTSQRQSANGGNSREKTGFGGMKWNLSDYCHVRLRVT